MVCSFRCKNLMLRDISRTMTTDCNHSCYRRVRKDMMRIQGSNSVKIMKENGSMGIMASFVKLFVD